MAIGNRSFYKANPSLKAANVNVQYTEEQVQEYVKCSQDPVYFIENYAKIISLDVGVILFKLYPYQKRLIDAIHNNNRVIGKVFRQSGKNLPLDTLIATVDGLVPMADIVEGSQVYGPDGKLCSVTAVTDPHEVNMFKLTFDDENEVICCEDHQWIVTDRHNTRVKVDGKYRPATRVMTAKDMYNSKWKKVNNRGYTEYAYYIPNTEPVQYPTKQQLVDPYLVGIWLGDGSSGDTSITTHIDYVDFLKEQGIELLPRKSSENRTAKTERVKGLLLNDLKHYNLFKNKHIPHDYLFGDVDQRIKLLQGLMDTNGFISRDTGTSHIQLGKHNMRLLDDVYILLCSLGLKVTKTDFPKTNSIRYSFSCPRSYFDVFRIPHKLERQPLSNPKWNYINSRTIQNIEPLNERMMGKCIQVDNESKSYLCTNSYIPTHNSQLLAAYMVWYILFNEHKTAAVLANKQDIAIEILGRVQFIIENLPPWLQQGVVEWNKKSVELENGSSCFAAATSPSAIRGKSVSLLALDEFGHLDVGLADEFIKSVFPTISSAESSKMVLISCVTKDTYIFSDKGIKQVSDFIDKKQIVNPSIGYLVPEYNVAGLNKVNSGSVMVNSGRSDTRIITSKSSQLECSLNHKLWACKNGIYAWYKSKDLEVGDYISINYGQNVWGNNDDISDYLPHVTNKSHSEFLPGDKISTDLAYVLGLYLAEGYSHKYCTTITCGDDISESLSVLNLPIGYGGLRYYISSVAFVEFLKFLGFDITKKAKEKTIPKRLLESSKEVLCSFLSGMFDGDGCAKNNGKISYASASLDLIKQVRMILLNLGITTQIYKTITKPTYKVAVHSTLYTIEINSYFDCNMFYDIIGFRLNRKQQRRQLLKLPLKNISKDVIPFGRDILKENGLIHKEPAYFKFTPHISRKTCLTVEGIEKLSGIVSPNIKWEKITSIEESENEVFDFSLDHIEDDFWCHSVLYNGIVGHQTPKGLNHFYKLWHDAEHQMNDFVPVEGNWQENPNRTQEWADKQLKELGKVGYQQEIECIGGETLVTVKDVTTGKIFSTAIQNLHETLDYRDSHPDATNWLKINHNYVISTPTGFQPFYGINRIKKPILKIKTTTSTIRVSLNHSFIVNDKEVKAHTVRKGDYLSLTEKVVSIAMMDSDYLYDPVNVGTDHIYYAGGLLHHNCSFIGSSYTLIEGNKLATIPYMNPIYHKSGLEVFKKPTEGNSYVICIDTSRGVHQDFSAFTVVDVTKMPYEVVVVFKDNTISTLEFPHLIFNTARQYNNAYLLVEINDLGEEVSNTIWYEYEYENIYFTKKDKLTEGRGYPGVRTTSKVKMLGCSVLKDLIEKDQLVLNSFSIIEELGLFVLKNRTYATDDPVINDDLCTTLWLFAWLTKQNEFQELVNVHLRSIIAKRKQEYIDQSMTPFMFYDDGRALDHLLEESKILPSKEMPNYLTSDQIELLMS